MKINTSVPKNKSDFNFRFSSEDIFFRFSEDFSCSARYGLYGLDQKSTPPFGRGEREIIKE